MPDIDQLMVKALIEGENSAYTAVIDELYQPVYRFALKLCREQSVAEDITQETFIAMWRGIGSLKRRSRFTTWVFGIAYHQFLRFREKRGVKTIPLEEWNAETQEGQSSHQLQELANRSSMLLSAIAGLPDISQHTIFLVYNQGLTYREAAEVMGLPIGTVKSRMNNAFKQLRERLGESETLCDEM